VCELTLGRFVSGVGAERPPTSVGVNTGTPCPPRHKLRRSAGQGATRRGLGTCGGARRGLRRALLVLGISGRSLGGVAPLAALMAGRGGMLAREGRAAV
jgi:hypothetical protein